MNCPDVRARLLDYQEGRLPPTGLTEVRAHLEDCGDCAHADVVEHELTSLLERRLPQHPASLALKRRITSRWPPTRPARWARWRPSLAPALAVAALVLVAAPVFYWERTTSHQTRGRDTMVTEAVNDHLRVLGSQHPLDVESGGLHRVKPWFEGRLDFAPVVSFEGDADFPLRGGAVGYFIDRKAAVFVYGRRLHAISLMVFSAHGLPWPRTDAAVSTAQRGFNVVLWRRGDLGYALVSDVDRTDLDALAVRLGAGPR